MNDIQKYPLALQLLMQTDGTVTELIKILSNEDIRVEKLSEIIKKSKQQRILHRHIYLQGVQTSKNWLYAESKIFLDNLSSNFVNDLLEKTIPIGTLWNNYKIETFKKVLDSSEIISQGIDKSGYKAGTPLLTRTYMVFNQGNIIMEIKENFPVLEYQQLILLNHE